MMRHVWLAIVGFAVCSVLFGSVDSVEAGRIIDLNSSQPSIQIQLNGTTLSTVGPQSTPAVFTGFLDWYPDITTSTASLTFGGITLSGSAVVNGTSILQQFSGGTLSLHDPAKTLLLSGNLSTSALAGTAGLSGGGLFTTSFSTVTGGVFAQYVDRPSLVFQMHLSNINGGGGLSAATRTVSVLQPFTASVDANIDGVKVPEPVTDVPSAVYFALTLASPTSRKPGRRQIGR